MGCAQSTNAASPVDAPEDSFAKRESQRIDQDLKNEKIAEKKTTKMLLLGAGESGKSTVVKQFKLIHQGDYAQAEREEYVEVVVQNIVQSMQAILEALPELNIRIEGEVAVASTTVLSAPPHVDVEQFRQDLAEPIAFLSTCRPVRAAISRRNEFQLNDSAEYFFSMIPRVLERDYLPSGDDILRSRIKTIGVIEHQIKIKDRIFRITDVGGQRSQRKKWLNVFSDINVLLFITSLAEYDLKLREDQEMSRLQESLVLFERIVNSSWFEKSTIILFLNKMDLFSAKLTIAPIEQYVSGFPPGRGLEPQWAARWLRQRYLDLNKNREKPIWTHFTSAVDRTGMKVVLAAVVDSILRTNLEANGLL